jgi:hypothetical protein
MMAPDSTPNTAQLSVESVDDLRSALNAFSRDGNLDAIRPALRRISHEAREKRMHPEHLLIALKDIWFALPEIARATPTDAQSRMLQRVVTLCIREYYGG